MADWSELPRELLQLIVQRLHACFDLAHFRSVCSSWRSSAPARSRNFSLRCPLPPDDTGFGDDCCLSRRRFYLIRSPPGDNLQDSPICWLFKVREEEDEALFLQNPFCSFTHFDCSEPLYPGLLLDSLNRQVIELGYEHMACYTEWFEPFEIETRQQANVAFMQLDAGKDDFAVLGTLSFGKLAMFRSVDKRWTVLENTTRSFQAITAFNGKFYVIDRSGRTTVIKPSLEVSYFQNSRPRARTRTVVQSGDNELLLVELFSDNSEYDDWYTLDVQERRIWFEVFKLNDERSDWNQVQDLGGRALFFGHCNSFSCSASEIPGIRGNSIFFKDYCSNGGCSFDRVLMYSLEDRSLRSIKDIPGYLELFWPPPGWVISKR